jgi:lambda repressor-like predicted transcriptional regulator
MDPIDVLYLVRKRGWSLAQIAKEAGVSRQILSVALRQPCIGGEKAILGFLKVPGC